MNYSNLQNLLNEYEEKRNKAISLSNFKKENLYDQVSSLRDIDLNINKASIDKIKLILTTKNQDDIYVIDQHINELKKERNRILTNRNINLDDYKPVQSAYVPKKASTPKTKTAQIDDSNKRKYNNFNSFYSN